MQERGPSARAAGRPANTVMYRGVPVKINTLVKISISETVFPYASVAQMHPIIQSENPACWSPLGDPILTV